MPTTYGAAWRRALPDLLAPHLDGLITAVHAQRVREYERAEDSFGLAMLESFKNAMLVMLNEGGSVTLRVSWRV